MGQQEENEDLRIPLVHPGEILLEEFLEPLGISQRGFAKRVGMSHPRVNEICLGKRSITVDTAARFSLFFGNSVQFWLNLQAGHDARIAEESLLPALREEITPWKSEDAA